MVVGRGTTIMDDFLLFFLRFFYSELKMREYGSTNFDYSRYLHLKKLEFQVYGITDKNQTTKSLQLFLFFF